MRSQQVLTKRSVATAFWNRLLLFTEIINSPMLMISIQKVPVLKSDKLVLDSVQHMYEDMILQFDDFNIVLNLLKRTGDLKLIR